MGEEHSTASIGTAGVFSALSQLWRLPGVSATHFPDHTPGVDLVAIRDDVIRTIQVKSTGSKVHRWRLYDDGRFPNVDFFILVDVGQPADRFFIIPTAALAAATEASYQRWRKRHGDDTTDTRFLGFDEPEGEKFLAEYEGRFDLLFAPTTDSA